MAGLAEEIRGLWDTTNQMEGSPVEGGRLDLSNESMFDVLNWLLRALTSVRSLDLEVFEKSDPSTYQVIRDTDQRGMAVRRLTAPRNNALHHPQPPATPYPGPTDPSREAEPAAHTSCCLTRAVA